MFQPKSTTKKIGDCEASHFDGQGVNCEVTLEYGNIWMCAAHKAEQDKLELREKAAKELVQRFKDADKSIHTDKELYNAKTVAAMEARASIQQNTEISEEAKEQAYTDFCSERFLHFRDLASQRQKELVEIQNEMVMWQTEGQVSAGKLREDAQAKYTHFRLDYKPVTVVVKKPKAIPAPRVSAKKTTKEAKEVAAKYGLDYFLVHMTAEAHNITHEDAAKQLVDARTRLQNLGSVEN